MQLFGIQCKKKNKPKRIIIITHFALEQLVVGSDELVFFGRFGDIFDASQQFVFVQELEEKRCCQEEKVDVSRCDVTFIFTHRVSLRFEAT